MAENCALSTGQDSSHPSPLPGDSADPDDVDASMQFMQLPALQAPNNRPPPHAEREQLPSADHGMLAPSQLLHPTVNRSGVQLSTCEVPNCTLIVHTADA